MFNFFKNKAYDLSISTMKTDMSRFVEMLKGMDDCAIGGLVVGANWVRKNLEQHGQIPDKILSIGPVMDTLKCNQASLEISKAIKNSLGSVFLLPPLRFFTTPNLKLPVRKIAYLS